MNTEIKMTFEKIKNEKINRLKGGIIREVLGFTINGEKLVTRADIGGEDAIVTWSEQEIKDWEVVD